MFGCAQISIYFFVFCNAMHASQLAVRYAIVHGAVAFGPCTNATLTSIVTPLVWGVPASSISVTTTWLPDGITGSTVTVNVSIPYPTIIPFAPFNSLPLAASAQGTVLY